LKEYNLLNTNVYDFVVIGVGIIGLSVAKELTEQFPRAKIALLEKEKKIGLHASGRNSGVLHSGIYYPQDSLKAVVCSKGAKRMQSFAKEHKISCVTTGKVIIATCEKDLPALERLLKNASDNNIRAERLNEDEIKQIEPNASVFQQGIYSPDTASIDSKKVLDVLLNILLSRGVELHLNHEVVAVNGKTKCITTSRGYFNYGYFYNCAGAGTDKIAKMVGLAKDYILLPFKGIYYKLKQEKNQLVKGHIYPVPNLELPFLGVHFTRSIDGTIYVGPTAIPAFGRENYGLIKGVSSEAFRISKDIALLYWANQQNFRELIHSEIKKYAKPYFMRAAKRLVNSIQMADLEASNKVGIRPQLVNTVKKTLEMDYIIEQNATSKHVLNAISPAFTSAFCFAELLVNTVK
jgi:L-2-hydroxyglutarate oxidase